MRVWLYKVTNTVSGKAYIGMTSKSPQFRWNEHIWHAYNRQRKDPLLQAIRHYGESSFTLETIGYCLSREAAAKRETLLIKQHNTFAPNGYNATLGGDGVFVPERSLEWRTAISRAMKGRPLHPNTIAARRRAGWRKGYKRPPEVGRKVSAAKQGVKRSAQAIVAITVWRFHHLGVKNGEDLIRLRERANRHYRRTKSVSATATALGISGNSVRRWVLGKEC